ncbi:MAG TPA: hypothetical protein PLS49_05070 [Candidatus Woesebacteria bacterium]|nr:hypothetical protein [Candidatus Woesebacteria bacterium]
MIEQKRYMDYYPTVWIDGNNQDSVFRQSRNFPKRYNSFTEPGSKVAMNEENPFYFYSLEYGYSTDVIGKPRKYIRTQIKSVESPYLQVEQLLYKTAQFTPYSITLQSSILYGSEPNRFMMSEYRHGQLNTVQVFLYPYAVKNNSGITLASIGSRPNEERASRPIQESIEKGEDLEYIYEDPYKKGVYTFALPVGFPQDLYPQLVDYFTKKELPALEEEIIHPEDLGLFVEMQSGIEA